jgi:hypothetical protein
MSEETSKPDDLTKTSKDDVTLTEADLNQVSGGNSWKINPEGAHSPETEGGGGTGKSFKY